MSRGIRARIDYAALRHNLRRARELAPDSRVMAVVKADGYGHGMIEVARSLEEADAFAVESVEAAVGLRDADIRRPVALLSGFHDGSELETIARYKLSPVIHDHWQVEALRRAVDRGSIGVWVKIDSGMHRVGFSPSETPHVLRLLEDLDHVRIDGLMSHLANADDLSADATHEQCRVFENAAAGWTHPLSLANSPGVLGWPATHLDWIRPGMMLYGCSPLHDRSEAELDLRPVMTLESRLIAVRTVPEGGAVGYGSTWRCDRETRVGVLACGYADGYPRHVPSGTPVWVNGRTSRVLGRVSMDLTSIDLTHCGDADVGDWAELWGANVAASAVAAHAGTIPYELVTRVTARVPRVYES